jgi:hypothetical protein
VDQLLDDALGLERAGAGEARFWSAMGWVLGTAQFLLGIAGVLMLLKLILVDWPEAAVRTELFACGALFGLAAAVGCAEKAGSVAGRGAAGQMAARLARAAFLTLQEVRDGTVDASATAAADYARRTFRQIHLVLSPEPEIFVARG